MVTTIASFLNLDHSCPEQPAASNVPHVLEPSERLLQETPQQDTKLFAPCKCACTPDYFLHDKCYRTANGIHLIPAVAFNGVVNTSSKKSCCNGKISLCQWQPGRAALDPLSRRQRMFQGDRARTSPHLERAIHHICCRYAAHPRSKSLLQLCIQQ